MKETLADKDVTVTAVDHDAYIERSIRHPFIQMQIRMGIYDPATIADEFLSVACTFAEERTIEVDTVLLSKQMEGVDVDLAHAYVQNIALHEYHHIENHGVRAVTEREQLDREKECNAYLSKHYPEVQRKTALAEAASPLIQKVYRRMDRLRP